MNILSIWGRVRVPFLGQKIVCESAEDEMRLDEDRGWEWEWEWEVTGSGQRRTNETRTTATDSDSISSARTRTRTRQVTRSRRAARVQGVRIYLQNGSSDFQRSLNTPVSSRLAVPSTLISIITSLFSFSFILVPLWLSRGPRRELLTLSK